MRCTAKRAWKTQAGALGRTRTGSFPVAELSRSAPPRRAAGVRWAPGFRWSAASSHPASAVSPQIFQDPQDTSGETAGEALQGSFVFPWPESPLASETVFVCLFFLHWKYFASRHTLVLFSTSFLGFCCGHISPGHVCCCCLMIVLVYL